MADEILSDEEVFGGGAAAPQPQPTDDGLLSDEDVFGERDDALRTTLRATTRASAGRDPALVAESERLARKYGLPVDTAERQIDTLRTQEELAQVDTFAQQAPRVAEWMASDPNAAALGKDDRDGLSALEQAFAIVRPVTDLKQSVMAGVVSGVGSAVSGGGEALNMRGRQIRRWQDATDAAGEGFWRMFSDDLGDRYAANAQAMRDVLPEWAENPLGIIGGAIRPIGASIEEFAQENIAVAEDRQNLATDIASGLGSLAPYLAAAYFTGGAGVLGLGSAQGVDVQADRAEAAGTYGTASADTGQAIGGAVTAVTERMGLGWLMRRLPPGAKKALNKRVADILMGGVGEAAQEMTESAVQDAVTKTLVDESFDMFQGIEREGLAAFGVGLLFRGVVHVARMEADAQQAEVEAETLGNIEAAVGGLKLAELSPERLREVLGRLKNSSVSDVFLPVDKFTALFQSEQEMGDALDAIGVDRAELSLALAENGQVRVPIEGYFTGMTPEQRAAAKPHARLTPAAMTPEEAVSFDREQALRDFIEATGEQGRPENDPTNWVADQVRAQLEAAGTDPAVAEQQAELYAAAMRTAIVRSGLSIEQLAGTEQDPRLTIRRDTPDAVRRVAEARNADAALDASIEALRSGRLFTDSEVNGQRFLELLRSKGGVDPGAFGAGDLRAMDAHRYGVLRRGGMTLEDAVTLAIENGYLNKTNKELQGLYDADGVDINTVIDMIGDDLGSTPVFSPEGFNVDRAAFNEATNELGRMLDELGIGREQLAEMDNAAIRAALGMNGPMDPDGIEFDQSAPVGSQAFRDWFQASKVAKPDGTPLVVYHGTGEEFEAFDKLRLSQGTGHASSGLGFYFTPSRRSAEGYAEKASDGVPANAVLLEVYLSVQNPYTMTLEEAQSFEDAAEAAVTRMMLQSQGYDGVWIPEQNAWVAFEPTQVKSIHNRGTWSRKDPRMLFQSVFHGSPHRGIEREGFKLQAIGTGEGAQAYGWGLYFAGKREIAEWYRKNLSRPDVDFGDLKPAKAGTAGDRILRHLMDKGETFSRELVASFVPRESLSSIPFDEDGDVSLSVLIENNFGADDFLSQGGNKAIPFDDGSGLVVSDDGDIKAVSVTQGQLYAAEIPDDGDLLDYDATLDEQPDAVRNALQRSGLLDTVTSVGPRAAAMIRELAASEGIADWARRDLLAEASKVEKYTDPARVRATIINMPSEFGIASSDTLYGDSGRKFVQFVNSLRDATTNGGMTGRALYVMLSSQLGSERAASEALLAAGIPGLRYLDGTSRNPFPFEVQIFSASGTLLKWEKARTRQDAEAMAESARAEGRDAKIVERGAGDDASRNYVIWDEGAISDVRTFYQSQPAQQRTPEFRAWFDGSQVVDENGEPLVVYHGTDANIEVFDPNMTQDGNLWFTSDRKKIESGESGAAGTSNIIPVYLSAKKLAGWDEYENLTIDQIIAQGYDGIKLDDDYIVFSSEQVKAVTNERPTSGPSIYNQQLDDTKRGSVNIIPGYPGGLDRYLITLGNRADKSTFLHESAHVFLELRKQINAQVAAIPEGQRTKDQQRIVEDDARLLEHLGVTGFDAIQRDQHEAFAESFEAYLREGKAPSPRLKRAFQSFRMWLTRIYRTLKGLPNANLTDEVRGYFDRMLATDEEIDAARSQLSLQPLLTGELRGDMSEDEYRRYLLAVAVSRDAAIEEEGAIQFAYAAKEAERMKSAELRELRREVEAEINADPVWRAIAMLRTGKTPDGVPLPEGEAFKLDTQAVTDLQGKEWVKKNLAGMHRREGGVHPDMAASVLGFKSATEMLQAIASKPTKRDAIEAEALRRWQERNPDPLLDGALEARVTKAVHNDAAAEMMLREINALSGAKKIALAQLREYVNRTVGKMAVRNLNPNRHKVAEMKHGREAIRAAAKGDKIKAAQARRSQLMAHLSYRAELDAKERAEAFRAEGVRLSKKPAQERLARAGWEGYLDKVNQILASFDLRRMSNKDIERKKSLRAWVEAQQEAGEITALSEELIARVEAGRVANWREATVGEIDAAADALANIQHLAKIKNKLTAARDGREWDEARTDLLARMQESLPDLIGGEASERDVGDAEGARRGVAGALANLNRPENVIEALDGGESGPWHDYVWTVLQDAENKAVGYRKELGAKLKAMRAEAGDVFKTMQDKVVVKLPNERGQVVDVAVSRATLIGIALNTGNGTNMQRLVDGGIAVGLQRFRLGPQNVQQLLSELRADELSFVQGMWDTVNSLWPDIVNLQRRMSGLPPEKVEARELTVASKDGKTVTLAGGYWPLVYDSKRSEVGETQDGADAMRMMMGAGFTKAFTPKGYQKARVETFEAPLQLDFAQVMSRHIDHVITDISHREAVRDINRILSDSEIKENLILRVGREGYDNLRGSLSYAVSASSAVAGRVAARWARGLDTVMANTSVAALAIRPDIALGNLTSATIQGLDRVGVKALMRGWWALETSRTRTTEAITSKSAFMAQRLGDTNFFFQQELHRLAGRRGWGPAYRRMMMVLHRAADAEVTRALWWGRYQQALDAGEGESQAVLMADKAVRQTQTANARKDISTFERDTQFKQARQFMGPMFVIFGRMYAAARGEGATQRVGARTSTLLIQVFLAPAIFALAAGRVPEDGDDDEEIGTGDWARWLAVNVGLFPLMTLPYLRDLTAIGEAAITGGQANPRANPTTQAVVSMGRAFQSLGQNAETYGETGEIDYLDATRDIFSILGPIVGAPAAQVRITTKTVESVLDDPEQGKVEMAKMAVYGPPREPR